MSQQVLVLNCGSSSIKFCLYEAQETELVKHLDGQIEDIGEDARWECEIDHIQVKQTQRKLASDADHSDALSYLFAWLLDNFKIEYNMIIGHRVVHGGVLFSDPIIITDENLKQLKELIPLAPLHQPHNLHAIEVLADELPHLKQVACFDTAFHASHQKPINQFAIPTEYHDKGVRRYGFHGLSYEYISKELKQQNSPLADGKYIAAHLGNGASLCAIKNGISIDSTMGFSALDGLMMGTRCGDIDPGVLLYLLDHEQMSDDEIAKLLYKKSGLLGVSGFSFDMRDLSASDLTTAKEAIDLYIYRIIREIGALVAVLNGIDGIVFTGGIGENAGFIREAVINHLGWLGADIDQEKNAKNAAVISTGNSKIRIEVLPTDEEKMLATHTLNLLA